MLETFFGGDLWGFSFQYYLKKKKKKSLKSNFHIRKKAKNIFQPREEH
jgi:hypothetical protein